MANPRTYEIVKGARQTSELEKFAKWFHQDWKLVYSDFYVGARMYFSSLSLERKHELRRELREFVEAHRDKSQSAWLASWLRAGAQGWQGSLDIRETLADFVGMLSADVDSSESK